MHWLTTTQLNPERISPSSPHNNQPNLSITNCINAWLNLICINQLHLVLIQRGILSPTSCNNHSKITMSVKYCINWLLLDLNPKALSFLSQQSTNSVNQGMHFLTTSCLNPKRNTYSHLSQQSTKTILINNCINQLLTQSKCKFFLLPLHQSTSSANQWMHGLTTSHLNPKRIPSSTSSNNQPKHCQSMIASTTAQIIPKENFHLSQQ